MTLHIPLRWASSPTFSAMDTERRVEETFRHDLPFLPHSICRSAIRKRASVINLDQIIGEYGLAGLFLGSGIEGETVVVIGGTLVHRGMLAFLPAIAAAAAGSFLADQLFFLLGRHFRGHAFVRRMQGRAAFAKAMAAFDKHPALFVFTFRFIYGLRTISPLAIGTTRLPARTFLLVNAVAAVVWAAVFVSVGYGFGTALEAGFGRMRSAGHIAFAAIGLVVIVTVLVILLRRWRKSRSS